MMRFETYPLNEIDRFMWSADRMMFRETGRGNLCVLVLFLNSELTYSELLRQCDCATFRWLWSLRLTRSFTGQYLWRNSGESKDFCFSESQLLELKDLDLVISAWNLDPRTEPPVQLRILHTDSNRSLLACLWHHSLFDAHGAERFFHTLLTRDIKDDISTNFPRASKKRSPSFGEIARLRKHIVQSARGDVWYPKAAPPVPGPRTHYRTVEFSLSETSEIDQLCADHRARLLQGCVYIAASARAVAMTCPDGNEDFFVPVPHDTRKFLQSISVGNQLSFFFLRIRRSATKELTPTIENVLDQVQQMIECSFHKTCRPFFKKIQPLPELAYSRIIAAPTSGRQASFYVSDTGNSLSRFDTACGKEVNGATHFPPNFSPPGLTFVYTRFRDRLRVMIVHDSAKVTDEQIESLSSSLRSTLLLR